MEKVWAVVAMVFLVAVDAVALSVAILYFSLRLIELVAKVRTSVVPDKLEPQENT